MYNINRNLCKIKIGYKNERCRNQSVYTVRKVYSPQ